MGIVTEALYTWYIKRNYDLPYKRYIKKGLEYGPLAWVPTLSSFF